MPDPRARARLEARDDPDQPLPPVPVRQPAPPSESAAAPSERFGKAKPMCVEVAKSCAEPGRRLFQRP